MRFMCIPGCTACCDERGFVYLTEADLSKAAARVGLAKPEFERRFVYRTRHLLRFRKPRGAQCPFRESQGCGLHPDKPVQCRAFPFWPEILEDKREFAAMAMYCPGLGKGPSIPDREAATTADEMRAAYPAMYPPCPAQASKSRRKPKYRRGC